MGEMFSLEGIELRQNRVSTTHEGASRACPLPFRGLCRVVAIAIPGLRYGARAPPHHSGLRGLRAVGAVEQPMFSRADEIVAQTVSASRRSATNQSRLAETLIQTCGCGN